MLKTFLEKLRYFVSYTDRFERITLFEITQYFGSSLFLFAMWIASLPLILFSSQWIVLPLATLIIMSTIWYFFDAHVWLPDSLKAKTIPSSSLKKWAYAGVRAIEKWQKKTGPQSFFTSWQAVLRPLSLSLIAIAAFIVGFSETSSFLVALSLIVMPIGLLLEDAYVSFTGYFFLAVAAFQAL